MLNFYELIAMLGAPRYSTRPKPTPPPEPRWDDCPVVCLEINTKWASHLIGLLEALDQPDAWQGDEETVDGIREQVRQLSVALMGDNMSCCCPTPTDRRFTVEGTVEVSYDGGITWQDGGEFDPRNNTPLLPPLTGGEGFDARCEASQNVASHVKAAADQLVADLGTGVNIGGLVAAIFALLFFLNILTLGSISPLLIGLAVALLAAGDSAFNAAMTADVYYTFQCIIYCHMGDDGRLETGSVPAILSDIHTKLTGIASTYLYEWVKVNGEIGVNNMAATDDGVSGDSCEDCDCEQLCSPEIWELFHGTETYGANLTRGEDWIQFDLTLAPVTVGEHFARLKTGSVGECCTIKRWELISGGTLNISNYALCGSPQDGSCPYNLVEATGTGEDQTNCFVFGSTGAATVRVYFD